MQVKILSLNFSYDVFPSDKILTAIKKLRNFFDIVEVSSVTFNLLNNGYFNGKTGNYFLLVNEQYYAKTYKTVNLLNLNENLTVDVIKLDADFDNTINLLINSDSKNETYKLFNVSVTDLDGFLADFNVPYVIKNIDGDVTVKFNFTSIKEEDVDILRKKFILKYIDQIYSTTDTSPENLLIQMLTLRDMKISVAESFTGGNLSAVLTSVSGASKVFYEGQVVYNENAKHERLNVDKVTLAEYKPVSKQVAYEMCRGLLNSGNCDVCISTTGIAGPNSDDSNFPVGLCYIGVGVYDKIKVYKYHFKGSRADITAQGVKTALCLAVKNLK